MAPIYVDGDDGPGLMDNPIVAAQWRSMGQLRDLMEGMDRHIQPEIAWQRPRVSMREGGLVVDGGPYIVLDPPFPVFTRGGKSRPQSKATLFTWTTKMSCPSFSIPAGPPKYGGTCPAATRAAVEAEGSYAGFHEPLDGQRYICDLCYCGKNNYLMYVCVTANQMVHLLWLEREVQKGTFARKMAEAIAAVAQDDESRAMLARKLIDPSFFRIHDSGDFHRPDYYKQWLDVCYALPKIKFWAPTRMWVFEKWRRIFDAYPAPMNLALRPSALFLGATPPAVPGMDAGTTSVEGRMGRPVWNCPAYEQEGEHSCASARCRVCWKSKAKTVNYKTH